ncbi:MAG TPA: hypothetical protein VGX51_03825 [Solirubrobacteraceae bacterium]|jgi:hypothetical protein|nr:hypothetical protein [Solirubrobacteraceae bacterium]
MNAFWTSLKADLIDRRLRAVLLALCLGLVGALVYALTGGSSETPAPAQVAASSPSTSGIPAVAAPVNGNQAVAETTSGAAVQREGKARDPFTPLPGSKPIATAAAAGSSSSRSASQGAAKGAAQKTSQASSGSSGGSSSTSSGGTSSKGGKSTPSPHKSKPVYRVAILFGVVPEGTPAQSAQLTPYTNLKLGKKLPSSRTPLVSFHEVTAGGKRAVFEVVGEVFVKGSGSCLPSASQCTSIALAQGQSEELEYLPAGGGHPVVYDLQVVSITSSKAAAARARISLLHRVHLLALLASSASL